MEEHAQSAMQRQSSQPAAEKRQRAVKPPMPVIWAARLLAPFGAKWAKDVLDQWERYKRETADRLRKEAEQTVKGEDASR